MPPIDPPIITPLLELPFRAGEVGVAVGVFVGPWLALLEVLVCVLVVGALPRG